MLPELCKSYKSSTGDPSVGSAQNGFWASSHAGTSLFYLRHELTQPWPPSCRSVKSCALHQHPAPFTKLSVCLLSTNSLADRTCFQEASLASTHQMPVRINRLVFGVCAVSPLSVEGSCWVQTWDIRQCSGTSTGADGLCLWTAVGS